MTTSRDLIIRDEPLKQWVISTVHDHRFDTLVAFVRSEIAANSPDKGVMQGVNLAFETMYTFCDNMPVAPPYPSPGLVHTLPQEHRLETEKKA